MKQFFKVFRFEYGNYAKDKVFVGLTLVVLLAITLTLFSPRFIKDKDDKPDNSKVQTLNIIDNTDNKDIADFLKENMKGYNIVPFDGSLDDAKKIVTEKENTSVIFIASPLQYKYIVNNKGLYDSTSSYINELLSIKYKNDLLKSSGLSNDQINEFNSINITAESVIIGKDQTESFIFTYALMLILYMAVLMYGQFVAQSVVVEKSSRAMELLITSADPRSLIFGKILGTGFAGLSQLGIILLWSLGCFKLNESLWTGNIAINSIFNISPSLIAYTILFFILGFLLYAFIFGALASLASKMEEVGSLTMPATFIMIVSFVVTIFGISSDIIDSVLIKVLSYIPFSSPMAMFARITMNTASALEIAISIIILIVTDILIGHLAVAIYRIGILMYGKPLKFNELIRAMKNR